MRHRQWALRGAGLCRELATITGLSVRISAEEEWEEASHVPSTHSVTGMTPGALSSRLN